MDRVKVLSPVLLIEPEGDRSLGDLGLTAAMSGLEHTQVSNYSELSCSLSPAVVGKQSTVVKGLTERYKAFRERSIYLDTHSKMK